MIHLRGLVDHLRGAIEPVLPEGCPFVIGGGLIRDAFYGGRPGDIDVWLPSNITLPDLDPFIRHILNHYPGNRYRGTTLFTGPGAHEAAPFDLAGDEGHYGDVNNHWVIELAPVGDTFSPKINLMRSMTQWTGDAPSFFTSLMRNFDLDCCMYFIGYMPGQRDVNRVIIPRHIMEDLANHPVRSRPPSMNEVYWNRARLDVTSRERIMARVHKMNQKYYFGIATDPENIRSIPRDDIEAVPVTMRWLNHFFSNGSNRMAIPTRFNIQHEHQHELSLDTARRRWEQNRAIRPLSILTIMDFYMLQPGVI